MGRVPELTRDEELLSPHDGGNNFFQSLPNLPIGFR
jgi:hypothetical protein